jgi:hypothetical protein
MTTNFKNKKGNVTKVRTNLYEPMDSEWLEELPLIAQEQYDEYADSVFSNGDVVTNVEEIEDLDVNEIIYKLINKVNNLETQLEEYQKQTEIDITYLEDLSDIISDELDKVWSIVDEIEEEKSTENVVETYFFEQVGQLSSDINGLYDQVNAIESKIAEKEGEDEEAEYEDEEEMSEFFNLQHLHNIEILNLYYNSSVSYPEPMEDININIDLTGEDDTEGYTDGYEGEFEDSEDEIYDETKWGSEKDEVD